MSENHSDPTVDDATPEGLTMVAVCVGNTRTRIGAFERGRLAGSATHDNSKPERLAEAMKSLASSMSLTAPIGDGTPVVLSSVRPEAETQARRLIREQWKIEPLRIEDDLPIPVGRRLDPEALVGEDRLLNAAAAFDVLKQTCVVVDAGTAITIDLIDGAGTFHGGAIMPGAQLMLDAMHQRAALLPQVDLARPDGPVGHNTSQAMLAGVFHGIRGAVHGLVEQYAEHIGHYPLVIATGGDGNLLFREDDLIDRVVPDLTLVGMHVTLRRAAQGAGG